ncbi:Amino_acid transporter family protein [Hexamita inflata]|uniref:Amino acid transporter family protein n=1 Tax=Hexamita inflata TaxID=28002 RepID=A0AA86QRY5_9EUKA|nr:Amino acid transporter family protein [Hexamita inflata]
MQKQSHQTQLTSSTLLSQMMGASLLSCAFIFHKLGYVLALLAFFLTILFNLFSYKYYVRVAHYVQVSSYRELTEKVVSKPLSLVLDASIMITAFGFLTSYIIISSSAITNFFFNNFQITLNEILVKGVVAVVFIFPLCLLKSLKTLSKISVVSGVAIFVTVATVVVYFCMHAKDKILCQNEGKIINYGINAFPKVSVFKAILYFLMYIPSLQGNFTAHRVIPTLIKELQGPPLLKRKVVSISINIAMFMALILYLSVGLMGAAMFGEDIKDNILKAFAPCQWVWIDICSLVYAMVVINAYPLVMYPIKMSIVNLCKKEPQTKEGYRIQVIVSITYVILTTILAMTVEQILPIFGLFSSLTGIIFYFVVPVCFYVNYPKIKRENIHMDTPNDDTNVDPVMVGVLAVVSENSIPRIRAFSQRMFEKQIVNTKQQSVSLLRTQSISGKPNCQEQKQVTRKDSGTLHGDNLANLQITIETALEQSSISDTQNYDITNGRKLIGILLISLFSIICTVGVYMNGVDVIHAMIK